MKKVAEHFRLVTCVVRIKPPPPQLSDSRAPPFNLNAFDSMKTFT